MYLGRFGKRGVDCGVVFYGKDSFAEVVEEQRDREVGGNVETDGGGALVSSRGICWSTSHNPTLAGSSQLEGNGTGSYSCTMTGLQPNTTYYVRAYAVNKAGIAY
ncbi:MAG: fibronectin type III domain-containing protein, partial [Bacteroidales bacterium]|nr:fibronectin type III domain-containing protein [Bacteroidales bacterium]